MNVGELKKLIKDLPDDTFVMIRSGYFYCFETDAAVETIGYFDGETCKYDVEWLKEIDALDDFKEDDLIKVLLFDGNDVE